MTDSGKLDLILEKVGTLDKRMDTLENKMDILDNKVNMLDRKVTTLEIDMKEVKEHVRRTDLILENEIRVNIQRVAEGHLDLSRIFHDAIRLCHSEVEMLSLRLRMVESDVRQLKAKVS